MFLIRVFIRKWSKEEVGIKSAEYTDRFACVKINGICLEFEDFLMDVLCPLGVALFFYIYLEHM